MERTWKEEIIKYTKSWSSLMTTFNTFIMGYLHFDYSIDYFNKLRNFFAYATAMENVIIK